MPWLGRGNQLLSLVVATEVIRFAGIVLLGNGDCEMTFPLASTTLVAGS